MSDHEMSNAELEICLGLDAIEPLPTELKPIDSNANEHWGQKKQIFKIQPREITMVDAEVEQYFNLRELESQVEGRFESVSVEDELDYEPVPAVKLEKAVGRGRGHEALKSWLASVIEAGERPADLYSWPLTHGDEAGAAEIKIALAELGHVI
jgi:hypothetical protein